MPQAAALCMGGICLNQPQKWERVVWGRIVPFLVLVHVALNPFPHTTSIREITFYSAAVLLLFYFIRYRDWSAFRTPFTLPVALFTGWAFAGLFWALDLAASLHDIRAHLLKYIVLFLLLLIFFNSRARIRLLFWAIIVSVVVSGFHDMYFFYVVGKNSFLTRMAIPNHQLPVGPLGFMAVFASLLVAYLLRTGEGFWHRLGLSLCLAGLLLIFFVTQMRSLLVALPFVFGVFFWDNKKNLAVLLIVLLFFFYLFFTKLRALDNVASYTDRLTINYISLLMIKERPVVGIGYSIDAPGNHNLFDHEALRARVPEKIRLNGIEYNNPHNEWLGLAVRLGLVGFFLSASVLAVGTKVCFAAIRQPGSRELHLAGQLCLSFLVLFAVYGLFNVIFTHLLELLLCLSFALTAFLQGAPPVFSKAAD